MKTTRIAIADVEVPPPEKGGRKSPIYPGYRPTIRFSGQEDEWLKTAWDIEVLSIELAEGSPIYTFKYKSPKAPSQDLAEGQEFDLLEGDRVVVTGKIRNIDER